MKKLVIIGAVALVVLGCVVAAGCTSTTTDTDQALSLPGGEWICTNYTTSDGKTVTAVQTIKADGTGYWMELNDSKLGFQLNKVVSSTFSKPDQNGVFEKVSSSGKSYKMVYDAEKGTITQEGDKVYTRVDPIVGIWYGISAAERGSGNATTIINPHGTGLTAISYDDGTVLVSKLTWTKNTDGTYAMVFNGSKQTYTVASDGKTLKTADGRSKTKQFLDTSFLVSVAGAWYNKEGNVLMVFNGDGTGTGLNKNGVLKFTWKPTEQIGKFAITHLEGTLNDGTSLKDKTFEWTYDRDNDVFTSGKGFNFTHPLESIEGKITLL